MTRRSARLLAALCVVAGSLAAAPAHAYEDTLRRTVQVRVGETLRLAVFGGHKPDCVTSTAPQSIAAVQPPRLGTLVQRPGVEYTSSHSLSGTCIGARFIGTAVEYTARAPGSDTVALDVSFPNGVAHWIYTVTVTP